MFKVFQSGELALADSADSLGKNDMPNLLALRNAIYSSTFRDLVSKVTGVSDLTERVDCSANAVSAMLFSLFCTHPNIQYVVCK